MLGMGTSTLQVMVAWQGGMFIQKSVLLWYIWFVLIEQSSLLLRGWGVRFRGHSLTFWDKNCLVVQSFYQELRIKTIFYWSRHSCTGCVLLIKLITKSYGLFFKARMGPSPKLYGWPLSALCYPFSPWDPEILPLSLFQDLDSRTKLIKPFLSGLVDFEDIWAANVVSHPKTNFHKIVSDWLNSYWYITITITVLL